MGKSFKTVKTNNGDEERWEDNLPFELKDIRDISRGAHTEIRLLGYVTPFMRFWVPTEASKAKDPYKTQAKMYPAVCVDFDPDTEEFVGDSCLYRKAHYAYVGEDGEKKFGKLKPSKNFLIFFIDRERQEERSGVSIKKKIADSKKFSDIQCATVPTAFARGVQSAMDLFEKKYRKSVDPCDPVNGFDLFFKFDKDAKAEAKYDIQLGDPKPLTDEELKQADLIPEEIRIFPKDSEAKIRAALERSGYIIVEHGDTPEETIANKASGRSSTMRGGVEILDEDDEAPKSRNRRPSPPVEEEESFDDEENDLGLDEEEEEVLVEEEEEAPAPKSQPKPKPAPVVDEEDEDLDFGDFEDGED